MGGVGLVVALNDSHLSDSEKRVLSPRVSTAAFAPLKEMVPGLLDDIGADIVGGVVLASDVVGAMRTMAFDPLRLGCLIRQVVGE